MMNVLDSRGLDRTNCFAQCFNQQGSYRYAVVPALGGHFSQDLPYVVTVAAGPATGEGSQHNVEIAFRGGHFTAAPESLSIKQGDVVLWTSIDEDIPRYAVIGKDRAFASDRLTKECVYTHIFGLPGTYRWVDAHGSPASGTITVTSPDSKDEADLARWRSSIGGVALVKIKGAKSGNDAAVVVGQQVFFAVEEAPGISIT
ncbi:MAG: hypothetical protein QOI38_97, partial [Sphingomonadales bacterium]|nr:hypothetical protein [Sphingomonadales bacterium]